MRPEFVLRVVNRFQRVAGFDRSIALASSALTAVIPLAIVTSALASQLGGRDTADRIIDRYQLTGGGADAIEAIFAPASGTETTLGIAGVFFLLLGILSFTRAVQRLFEQTWELKPLSLRNTLNGLVWSAGLAAYIAVNGVIRGVLGRSSLELTAAVLTVPLSVVFLLWSGRALSGGRIAYRSLLPFAAVAAVACGMYSVGATVYLPHLFDTYATRYGAIGAVFALISSLFCIMLIIVASAVTGREVDDELDRIRRGERPAEDEVRRQWDALTAEARARWAALRVRG